MISGNAIVGTADIALVTLDTLRYDVAVAAMAGGETPVLAGLLPDGWEERHSPGSFTYASHRSFFAGFLPTPARPGRHERPLALEFAGSETTGPTTCRLAGRDIVEGLSLKGYRTVCVGGVGFFDPATPLGADLTGRFQEVHWEQRFGVAELRGFEAQIERVEQVLGREDDRLRFTFLNVSSLHQPNCHHLPGATEDSAETQRAALAYVDRHLARLLMALAAVRDCWVILCSDHGTAYGDDGYVGHRLGHPVVWTVPYAEIVLPGGWRRSP